MDLFTDNDLFYRIADNDERAFRHLYDRYVDQLLPVAFRMTKSRLQAEEIVQEVFIRVWTSRYRLPAVEKPNAYLFKILYNQINDYLTKEVNHQRLLQQAAFCRESQSNITEETIALHESEKKLAQAIALLSPQQRLVYQLHRQEGLSTEEIARTLNLSPHTVKVHLARARESVRSYLRDISFVTALLTSFRDAVPF